MVTAYLPKSTLPYVHCEQTTCIDWIKNLSVHRHSTIEATIKTTTADWSNSRVLYISVRKNIIWDIRSYHNGAGFRCFLYCSVQTGLPFWSAT